MQWSLHQSEHGETLQCPSRRGEKSLTAVISNPIMHDAALGQAAYAVGAWRARPACFRARKTVATTPPRALAGTHTRQPHTAASSSIAALESIQWTPSPPGAALQYMGIDHSRVEILMPQQLLDGTNVGALFQQMGRKRVAQRMTAGGLGNPGTPHRGFHRPLQHQRRYMDACCRFHSSSLTPIDDKAAEPLQ